MGSVLIAGRIAPQGRVFRPVGDFTVTRRDAGRYAVSSPGEDFSSGVVAVLSASEGTRAHYRGDGDEVEIHTVRSEDGSYIDARVDFVIYRVA